ncbi:MAG TPA: hypothetical protein VMH02_06435 [Verrucomicrobiae bacterium]|nr:hypothetical protein [Verrucomicrobiae bacterium]
MPKPVFIIFAVAAAILAACGGGSSSATPTPAPSISFTPNPDIKAATISVTFQGSPAPGIPVAISTPLANNSASPRPGTPLASKTTEPSPAPSPGYVTFRGLKPANTYCWVAKFSATVSFSQCAGPITWQYQTITLGN